MNVPIFRLYSTRQDKFGRQALPGFLNVALEKPQELVGEPMNPAILRSASGKSPLLLCRPPPSAHFTVSIFGNSPSSFLKFASHTFGAPSNNLTPTFLLVFRRSYNKKPRKMPPKKAVKEEKIMLGRPGNNLKSGIVRLYSRKC
jgi:hypothetical protein